MFNLRLVVRRQEGNGGRGCGLKDSKVPHWAGVWPCTWPPQGLNGKNQEDKKCFTKNSRKAKPMSAPQAGQHQCAMSDGHPGEPVKVTPRCQISFLDIKNLWKFGQKAEPNREGPSCFSNRLLCYTELEHACNINHIKNIKIKPRCCATIKILKTKFARIAF